MSLQIEDLTVHIGNKQILSNINMEIMDGEFISLLGPSGCGKTTLLKTIAGFLQPQKGFMRLDGADLTNIVPHKRNIVVMFQDLRLFPNMCVWENIAFPLKMRGVDKSASKKEAYHLLQKVSLSGMEKRKISQLSGGQQQRVALARAFAAKPKYLLLDEPFSNLDEQLKDEMRDLLSALQKDFHSTVMMVTHDKAEALMLSDRVGIMSGGTILQYSKPKEIYEKPNSVAVAQYMGNFNFLRGKVENGCFQCGKVTMPAHLEHGLYTACISNTALSLRDEEKKYRVLKIEYLGYANRVFLDCGECTISVINQLPIELRNHDFIGMDIDMTKVLFFKDSM